MKKEKLVLKQTKIRKQTKEGRNNNATGVLSPTVYIWSNCLKKPIWKKFPRIYISIKCVYVLCIGTYICKTYKHMKECLRYLRNWEFSYLRKLNEKFQNMQTGFSLENIYILGETIFEEQNETWIRLIAIDTYIPRHKPCDWTEKVWGK